MQSCNLTDLFDLTDLIDKKVIIHHVQTFLEWPVLHDVGQFRFVMDEHQVHELQSMFLFTDLREQIVNESARIPRQKT